MSNDSRSLGHVAPGTASAVLRAQLLEDLDDDVLPMAHVESIISRRKLADTVEARQALALDVIGALLREQRILAGDVVGGDPAYIEPWPGTPKDILERIRSLYLEHYAHSAEWVFRIWFSLNDERKIFQHTIIS